LKIANRQPGLSRAGEKNAIETGEKKGKKKRKKIKRINPFGAETGAAAF